MYIIQQNTTEQQPNMNTCIDTINRQALRILELEEQVSALRRELANVEEKEPEEEATPAPKPEPVATKPTPAPKPAPVATKPTPVPKKKRASPTYKPMHAPEKDDVKRFVVGQYDDCEKVVKITINKHGVKHVHLVRTMTDEDEKATPRRHTVYYEWFHGHGREYYKRKGQGTEYWDKFYAE